MSTENEKRQFHRIFYNAKATLATNSKTWDCEIIDLCLNGCLLHFATAWQQNLDDIFTLRLNLSEDTEISMDLKQAHAEGNNVGFKCEQIDIDSISQLRRMVELNLGDSEMLERDLSSLVVLSNN